MSLDVHVRHRLASLLGRALGRADRFDAACRAASLTPPPARGSEPPLARVTALLLAGAGAEELAALVEAAAASEPSLADALRRCLGPPARDEDELATVRVLDERTAVRDAPPRPAGTPAEAPPREGARAWLLRRVHLSVPTSVRGGEEFGVQLTLARPGGGSVPGAPEGAVPWGGAPVDVDYELWLEEAFPIDGHSGTVRVDPATDRTEVRAVVKAALPLHDGVDIVARFFAGGYEVGRARAFVPDGARDDVEPRPASPGALAVPDTVIS
jgi:hypothetical protein